MTNTADLDDAMRAALEPLTEEQRRAFTDEMHERFPDASSMTADADRAQARALQLACSRLLSDPLDPVGEAWSRFAGSLFARCDRS
jgi:hypothetical protein